MKGRKILRLRGLFWGLCLIALAAGGLIYTHGGGPTLPPPEKPADTAPAVREAPDGEGAARQDTGEKQPPEDGKGAGETAKKIPPGPYLAVVIDDFGFSKAIADGYGKLSLPLTWAVIPFQTHSSYAAKRAEAAGIPYMIHMPMGAGGDKKWDEKTGVIDTGMEAEKVSALVKRALESLPGALGMNNHRGSRATRDKNLMEALMTELSFTSLFFLDSRTASDSVAYKTARAKDIPSAFCSVFLDHEPSEEYMEAQYERGVALAAKRGWVVMIAHARTKTLEYLTKLSERENGGATFVTMPELMEILWNQGDMSSKKESPKKNSFQEKVFS